VTTMADRTESWLTVQFFLDDEGVHEVSVAHLDQERVRCSCPRGSRRGRCAHIRYVKDVIRREGRYSVVAPDDTTDEDIEALLEQPDEFRSMVAHHSNIVVLDAP
jgi:hypothetical protein